MEDKLEQIKSLQLGGGFQFLVNEAYRILGNPVIMHDMEYKVIAYTENIVTDDPIWNEFVMTGTVSRERLEFYKNEKFLEEAANAEKVAFLSSDKLKYDRMLGKLFNGDNLQIGIAAIEGHKPFSDDTQELFACFLDILEREIAKNEHFLKYGQEYQESLVAKLIDGGIDDKGIYAAHVESIYTNLKDCLFVAVADITQCEPAHTEPSYFRDLFKRAQPAFKYAVYGKYVLILLSFDNAVLDVKTDLGKLDGLFKQHNLFVGISSCFDNLYDLRKYYLEAVAALHSGMKGSGDQRFFLYPCKESV